MILNALSGKPLPVYGDGRQVRDWLYVEDHARALWEVLTRGKVGETYNIGGHNEQRNIDVVRRICSILDRALPATPARKRFEDLITFVTDRPGHDTRYAIDAQKIGITGNSFGSFFATIAAANEPRIKAVTVSATCLEPGGHTIFEEASPTFKRRFMYMSGYHDALTDCRITVQMYQKIADFLKQHQEVDIMKYQLERIKVIKASK